MRTIGTLSGGNKDGKRDPETCEMGGNAIVVGILKIKQRCCNAQFCTVKFTDLIDIHRDQFSISHIDDVLNDDELLLLYDLNWSIK